MSTPKFSRLDPAQRREQILDAASALFAERAYDEVSIEDIASAAGVTRGLVHHYFGGRNDVYIALLERLGAQREEQLRPPAGRSARARVADTVSRWLDWTEANRTIWLATIAHGEDIADPDVRQVGRRPRAPRRRAAHDVSRRHRRRTRRGCATRSSAGPASTAPRHDAGYAARPPAKPHTNCSPPRSNTSCAPSALQPRHAGAHLLPASRRLRMRGSRVCLRAAVPRCAGGVLGRAPRPKLVRCVRSRSHCWSSLPWRSASSPSARSATSGRTTGTARSRRTCSPASLRSCWRSLHWWERSSLSDASSSLAGPPTSRWSECCFAREARRAQRRRSCDRGQGVDVARRQVSRTRSPGKPAAIRRSAMNLEAPKWLRKRPTVRSAPSNLRITPANLLRYA